jgi:hypothetical protein
MSFWHNFQCRDLDKNLFSRGEISFSVAGFFGGPRVTLRENKRPSSKDHVLRKEILGYGGHKKRL